MYVSLLNLYYYFLNVIYQCTAAFVEKWLEGGKGKGLMSHKQAAFCFFHY